MGSRTGRWVLGLALLGLGCEVSPPDRGARLEPAEVCVGEHAGVVTVRGYLAPRRILSLCRDTCDVDLFPEASRRGAPLRVRLPVGDGASQMAPLPEGYGDRDLRLRDGHGDALAPERPVLVTGARVGEPPACVLLATWLEAAP